VLLNPVVVESSLGVDTTVAAAIAPAGNADQIPVTLTVLGSEDIRATRVTLAGVQTLADVTAAHLRWLVEHVAEALFASLVSQVTQVHLSEGDGGRATAAGGTPASSRADLVVPLLGVVWDADWDDVVVVEGDIGGELHQSNVVSEGGRAVLRVHDDTLNSLDLDPVLVDQIVTVVASDLNDVVGRVRAAEDAVSSSDKPSLVDDRAAADESVVTLHERHPAVIALVGDLVATDDLELVSAATVEWSLAAVLSVDGQSLRGNQAKHS